MTMIGINWPQADFMQTIHGVEIWYYHLDSGWAAVLKLGRVSKELFGFDTVVAASEAAASEAKTHADRVLRLE
jgi:hypothetical protein